MPFGIPLDLVDRTLHSHCWGPSFNLWWVRKLRSHKPYEVNKNNKKSLWEPENNAQIKWKPGALRLQIRKQLRFWLTLDYKKWALPWCYKQSMIKNFFLIKAKMLKVSANQLLSTQLIPLPSSEVAGWHTCCVGYWISNICSHHGVRIRPHPRVQFSAGSWGLRGLLENHKKLSILRIERETERERDLPPKDQKNKNSEYLKYNWTIKLPVTSPLLMNSLQTKEMN